jgi:hypothetical protein
LNECSLSVTLLFFFLLAENSQKATSRVGFSIRAEQTVAQIEERGCNWTALKNYWKIFTRQTALLSKEKESFGMGFCKLLDSKGYVKPDQFQYPVRLYCAEFYTRCLAVTVI